MMFYKHQLVSRGPFEVGLCAPPTSFAQMPGYTILWSRQGCIQPLDYTNLLRVRNFVLWAEVFRASPPLASHDSSMKVCSLPNSLLASALSAAAFILSSSDTFFNESDCICGDGTEDGGVESLEEEAADVGSLIQDCQLKTY